MQCIKKYAKHLIRQTIGGALYRLLMHVDKKTALLKDNEYLYAVLALGAFSCDWVRSVESWIPRTYNRDRQFASLSRHLLAKYDVPTFMNQVWFTTAKKRHRWFVFVGQGMNIRKVPGLPIEMTKKMAHHFMRAPDSYSINEALRWGQVMALGGDKRLVEALRETRLIRSFSNNDFWLGVLTVFYSAPNA